MIKRGEVIRRKYSTKELKYKLFGKKICPLCKSKMTLECEQEYAEESHRAFGVGAGRSLGKPNKVYQVTEYYCCEKCDKKFTLSELAEGK